jgi:PDZ domain
LLILAFYSFGFTNLRYIGCVKIKIDKTLLLLFFLLTAFSSVATYAQRGFFIPPGRRSIDIPFQYTNNFIILSLEINRKLHAKFIFDTGAEHSILTKKIIGDLMGMNYEKEFRVMGSDLKTPIIAYLVRNTRLDLPEKMVAPQEDILVLAEDYFNFEENVGIEVHGILSGNAFARYVFKINYEREVITLYDRESFKEREYEGFTSMPIEVYRNKPYLNSSVEMVKDSIADVRLLIDTGAGLPLLLFAHTHPLLVPPSNSIVTNIGAGLGGDLEGFTGRIHRLQLGPFDPAGVISYFQSIDSIVDLGMTYHRNGLMGNLILERFEVIFDYYGERIWLKPNKKYKEMFEFDRSGLSLVTSTTAVGPTFVRNVLPNSPAAMADIRRGDILVRVGRVPSTLVALSTIQKRLRGPEGKKIVIVIKRDGKRIKKEIVLRDLL